MPLLRGFSISMLGTPKRRQADVENTSGTPKTAAPKALTRIHRRIHCVATQAVETPSPDEELEALQVETFLDVLAEIAMNIAKREQNRA